MSNQSITAHFKVYLELRKSELSAGTVDIYTAAIRRLVAAAGDIPPRDLSAMEAMRFIAGLSAKGLSATTVNMQLRACKTFFRWLVVCEQIGKSPFGSIRPLREPPPGRWLYSPAEAERILAVCPDPRWRMIVALAVTAGLRRGEILNLTVGEIDYAAGVITLSAKVEAAGTWVWDLKDHQSRAVPISPLAELYLLRVHAALPAGQPYIALRPQRWRHLIARRNKEGGLDYATRRCPEVNFLRTFRAICARAGVGYRTFHALRGTGLSILADNGLQPHELQAVAGHSDVRTTYRHYVRPHAHLEKARLAAFRPQHWAVQDLNLRPPACKAGALAD